MGKITDKSYAWAIIMQTHGSETGHDEFCRSGNDLFCVDLEELAAPGAAQPCRTRDPQNYILHNNRLFEFVYKSNYVSMSPAGSTVPL